jgi:hydroxymethylpyrimidine pyrophosphatase-like HAD family hydrolase
MHKNMDILPPDIKLLAIDIDGTLLTPQKQITPRTRAAVRAAQEAGIIVTLATARRYCNTAPIAKELGLDIPLILCDGALIMQHPCGTVLQTHPLRADLAQRVVDLVVQETVQPVVHHINGAVEEMWLGPVEFDTLWLEGYLAAFPDNIRRLPHPVLCAGQPDPLRVVVFASEEAVYGLIPGVSALPCSWNAIKRGNFHCAELAIMAPGCSKASGVATLAGQLGISLTQVMAIGDNNNDLEMLSMVGWGVAMGHAPESVKQNAKAITASNAEDGAALAIERYALRWATSADSNSFKREICL